MKKSNLFLFISSFGLVLPLILGNSSYPMHATMETYTTDPGGDINSNNQEEGLLDYEEETNFYDKTRYYSGFGFGKLQENFRAPAGCVLTIDADWNYLLDVRTELQEDEYFAGKEEFNMVNVALYRHINGSKMYSDSDTAWNVRIIDLENFVTESVAGLTLYEINDKIADVEVSATVEVTLSTMIPEYEYAVDTKLVFEIEPYRVKKYIPGDILSLEGGYYGERIAIRAQLDENLFNEKYGFKTDGREPYSWDETQYWENYLVQYFDKDTNIILDTDDARDTIPGIELQSMPTKPLTVFALLTFKQDGVEYKFYSNELVIKNPISGLLIDGYNNRDSIGVNTNHKLKLAIDHSYDDLISAWIRVSLQGTSYEPCNHVCEPEEYWYYFNPEMKAYTTVSDEFWEFDFNYDVPGEYQLLFQVRYETEKEYYDNSFELPLLISKTQEEYTPIDKALTFDVNEERIDCVAGGGPIDLEALIANDVLNDGEEPIFEWSTSRLNVVEIIANGNKVKVNPIGGGVVTLSVTCYGSAFGSVSKSIVINVIDDIYSITTLSIPDEFHYSGKDLTIGLNIDKYSSLANFKPEWKVLNANDEEIPYIDNGNCSITIEKPVQSDYSITVLYNGVEIETQIVQVRNINVDKFIQNNIIWIVLITLGFMALVIFLKVILEKRGSLVSKIEKTNKMFTNIDRNSVNVVKQLNKVRFSIIADIDYARSLNMNALNEYEKTIRYLAKSLAGIKDITKNKMTMSSEQYALKYEQLSKDLAKALIVAKEIEDAKELALNSSFTANENNIVKIDSEKKKSKKNI